MTVCRMHGGSSPAARSAAARRLAVQEARRTLGVPTDVDPLDVLLDQVREAAGNVAAYRLAIEGLGVHVGDDGVAAPEHFVDRYHVDAQAHILVQMYDRERDRLTRYAKLALDAGVDERRVRVAEGDAQRLAHAVGRALDHAELTPRQRDAFRVALADELRAIAGGG